MKLIKPSALPKGALIGVISPSSPLRDEAKLQKGIRYLESLGYRVELGKSAYKAHHYLAGSDDERLQDLHDMFADRRIHAIFCSRGGYGTQRYLSRIDYPTIKRNPKIFVGFSDTTALQYALMRKCGLLSFSGAMVSVDMHEFDSESEQFFWKILSSTKKIGKIQQSLPISVVHSIGRKKKIQGALVCGNLSLLAALCGTPYAPVYKDCILLSEDIGEEAYRVDRLLAQLELSGALQQSAALAFGQFTQDSNRVSSTPSRHIREVVEEYALRNHKPALANLMYGHTRKKLTLPMGVQCTVDIGRGSFSLDEAGVV